MPFGRYEASRLAVLGQCRMTATFRRCFCL